jgi:hypothetical protein
MLTCCCVLCALLQVLPGMLHSSHRLRLVSKRRRQMSYCYFQVGPGFFCCCCAQLKARIQKCMPLCARADMHILICTSSSQPSIS